MSFRRRATAIALLGISGCRDRAVTPAEAPAAALPRATSGWAYYAGDAGSQRYSALDDVSRANVAQLAPAWSWATGEDARAAETTADTVRPGKFEASPLAFGDTLFLSTPFNRVVALDGRSGKELWSFDPGATRWGLIADDHAGFVHRGVASWSGAGSRRLLIATRWSLFELDAHSGKPVDEFGDHGAVDLSHDLRWPVNRLHFGSTSPPVVWDSLVIVGSAVGDRLIYEKDPPGDVQAFSLRTGKRAWRWDPVPAVGQPERASWGGQSANRAGHVNVWAPMSVDVDRGLVFLPVSGPSNDFYGGYRLGDNLFSQSLVCLDARTGRRVWSQQLVHHDLWDYDLASPPLLVRISRTHDTVDAVVIATKTGDVFGFNRVNGEPIWAIHEQPVPPSDVPGEQAARSQPRPEIAAFAKQGFSASDIVDFSPSIRRQALRALSGKRMGPMFTPPSLQGTVEMPGWIGGAGWGSTAVDPVRQMMFIKATNLPILAQVVQTSGPERFRADSSVRDPGLALTFELTDDRWWALRKEPPVRLPVSKPPYGTLTAIDLTTGKQRWQITLGDTPAIRFHGALRRFDLPALGVAGAAGGIATASGLIFIAGGGTALMAIDAESGVTLWSHALGQMGYSNPVTYRATDGRQYVVVATGEGKGASLQAFALPARQ